MNRLAVGVALALVAQSQARSQEYGIRTPRERNPAGRSSADRFERLRHSSGDGARHRRQGRRRHLASRPADHGVPAMAADRRQGTPVPHRGEGRLRRGQPVRVRARLRPASRQHHQDSRAPRFVHAVGHDLGVHRLVSRPAYRLRVRCERGRRQDGSGGLRRRKRGQRVGWRLGRRHADRLARLDGRVPDPTITTSLRSREEPRFRIYDRPRPLSLQRAIQLADLPPVEDRLRVAIRLARGARRSRGAAPARGDAVRRHEECGEHRREPLYKSLRGDARRRSQVSRRIEPHDRRDDQPRLRAGRVRSGRAQPFGIRVLLRRAPAVLRRRPRPFSLRPELQRRQLQQRRALLQPAHRPHAAIGRHVRRHGPAGADNDPRRREAAGEIPERAHVRRARRDDAARVESGRHDVRTGDKLHGRARETGFSRRQQFDRRHGHGGEPERGSVDLAVPLVERLRGGDGFPPPDALEPLRV